MSCVFEAGTVMVAHNGRSVATLGPVAAGGVATGRRIEPVRVRPGQNVVHVDRVAAAANDFALLSQSSLFVDIVGI